MGHVHLQPVTFQHVIQCRPVHAGGLHDYRLDAAVLQPACHPMEVGCEAAKALYRFRIAVCGHGYVMFCTSHVDPRCIYIQWQKSFGRIHVPGGLPSLASLLRVFRHRVSLQLKSDGPGPVANRFMNLSNGVEPADQSQPTAANSLIARNRSHTRKRAQGRHISRGLDCRERPRQHLTLIPFLVPLTALRCPLLGNNRPATSPEGQLLADLLKLELCGLPRLYTDSTDQFYSLDTAARFLHSLTSSSPAQWRNRRTNVCVQPCSLRCKSADLVVLHLI